MTIEQTLEFEQEEAKVGREILETQRLVKSFLIASEEARNSDAWLLYLVFLTRSGILQKDLPFEKFKIIGCAETVTRCRRKVVEENPELQPTDEAIRNKRQNRDRTFAKVFGARTI